ncbi:hypothetical protein AX14_004576 [Amanita brunnescens Koide BX004]|nr:hypothetical protein AX14_004576 [Amanita brunnescens Koide BX004]
MEPLPTGAWPIYVVSYVTRPPISRPIGVEAGRLVVLPEGYNPPHFEFKKTDTENQYTISLDGVHVAPVNDNASVGPAPFPFIWLVLRGAPSPPPIGNKSFGIIVPRRTGEEQRSWDISQDAVVLDSVAASLFIDYK